MKRFILLLCLLINISYAESTTEIVVPYSTGGSTGSRGQLVSEILSDGGIPNIVSYKPGAGSVIGINYVAKANPNGRTLLIGTASGLVSNIVFSAPGMQYNEKSFAPVITIDKIGIALITGPNAPFKNYEQLKFYLRANPEKFNVGCWSATTSNVWIEWAKREKLPKPNIILYKGSSQMLVDVAAGNLEFAIETWPSAVPLYKANQINIIAVSDAPTLTATKKINQSSTAINIAKQYPDLEFSTWFGVFAPAGTPKSIINNLNTIINRGLKDPKYHNTLETLNVTDLGGGTPEKLDNLQKSDIKRLMALK